MGTLGQALRAAREAAGMTVAQVSAATRVRQNVILDLENDKFVSSGGVAYARGHIRTIAGLIGADSDSLIALLEEATGEVNRPMIDLLTENYVTAPKREGPKVSYKTLSIVAATIVGLLILVPALSGVLKASPTKLASAAASASDTPSNPSPTITSGTVVATKTSDVTVIISAVGGSSWLGVTDSTGTQVFNGTLVKGQTQTFSDNQLLRFVIGNAGAVNLNVNGVDSGTPGATGEVVHLEFGPGATSQG